MWLVVGWSYRKQSTLESFNPERWSQFRGHCRLAWEMMYTAWVRVAHVIEDEWSGCYLTLQYKPVCGCFGGTVNPVPVMTRVWVTKQHLYSYITLPCRVLFFNLIMIRPCEEVGHFSILCALLVRAAGLNCSVGIHGGSMEKLKGGKISIFLSSKLKNWI